MAIERIGQAFGRLRIFGRAESKNGRRRWLARCACGSVIERSFRPSGPNSCGCAAREALAARNKNVKRQKRRPDHLVMYTWIATQYRCNAKTRGLLWELPTEVATRLVMSACNYCGVECSMVKRHTDKRRAPIRVNGIDRVDNNVGYTVSNCVPCCKTCNKAKSDMTLAAFLEWLNRVRKHTLSKAEPIS